MSTFEVTTNADVVAAGLTLVGARVGARAFAVTRHHGMLLQSAWKRKASLPRSMERWYDREGLRLITGDYVRRINLRMVAGDGTIGAEVGTNHPGGRRLEFGFVGTDSIGRTYHQPPYPTARPALAEVGPGFQRDVIGLVDEAWK